MATKEDLVKTIVKYGPIKNIKLEQDRSIISETKEKKKFLIEVLAMFYSRNQNMPKRPQNPLQENI